MKPTISKKLTYVLFIALIFSWGLEFVVAKTVLTVTEPLTVLFFKYIAGLIVMLTIKLWKSPRNWFEKKDALLLLSCSLIGVVAYHYFEYSAMDYIPVTVISLILSFLPVASLITEKLLFRIPISKKLVAGMFAGILGVAMIIGLDLDSLRDGKAVGYLLAILALLSWNVYNFLTISLHDRYDTVSLTLYQILATLLIVSPIALAQLPPIKVVDLIYVGKLCYMGAVGTAGGLLGLIQALRVLGATKTSLILNFLPLFTAFWGYLLLDEQLGLFQAFGGIIVLASSYFVIREKGRLEGLSEKLSYESTL